MKLKRCEKIWLIAVVIFYVGYNLPFVPGYGNAKGTLIHALLTLLPLWISVYVGLTAVCRNYKIRSQKKDNTSKREDKTC